MSRAVLIALGLALGAAFMSHTVLAQSAPVPGQPAPGAQAPLPHGAMHGRMPHGPPGASGVEMPGQDAFGAIAEIVRILDADPATDWTRVDLERLRQHLIDMNEVVLRSQVKPVPVPGGLAMEITGSATTERAIRAMVVPHAAELARMPALAAQAELMPGGVRLTVTAKTPQDPGAVARIRGLGFAGLLTLGAHHGPHHLAMARGESPPHR
jgi:hypothetical protein